MSSPASENNSLIKEFTNIVTKNLGLKFLSFVFAVIIFFIVRTDKEISFERTAKVKVVAPHDMVILGSKEFFLDMTIKQQNSLFSIPPDDSELVGEVDISTEKPGHVRIKVTRDNFSNLPKQYVVFIDRPFIDLEIDKLQEKLVVVQPILNGSPKNGIKIDKINIYPSHVKIIGARQELAQLKTVSTIPIDINGIDTNLTTNVSLDLDPNSTFSTNDKLVLVTILLSNQQIKPH